MIFRFVAALGIGGEWAVGSALLSETWPSRWRPWAAACLQTAVNLGVLLACAVYFVLAANPRMVFLFGVLPALIVFWIRKSVPEPAEWLAAQALRKEAAARQLQQPPAPSITDPVHGVVLDYEVPAR